MNTLKGTGLGWRRIGIALGVAGLALLVGCSTATEDPSFEAEETKVVEVVATKVVEAVEVQPVTDCFLTAACEITNDWDVDEWAFLYGILLTQDIPEDLAGCLVDATMLRLTPTEYMDADAEALSADLLANECAPLFN